MFCEFRSHYHKLNHALQVYQLDTALALWSQDSRLIWSCISTKLNGLGCRLRTYGLMLPKQADYQLSQSEIWPFVKPERRIWYTSVFLLVTFRIIALLSSSLTDDWDTLLRYPANCYNNYNSIKLLHQV